MNLLIFKWSADYKRVRFADSDGGIKLRESRTFSTENDCQFETIGAFWDELAAKYGRANLQGLGYVWTDRSIEYVIGLKDGEIDGADRTVELPDTGWVTVRGRENFSSPTEAEIQEHHGKEGSVYHSTEILKGQGGTAQSHEPGN